VSAADVAVCPVATGHGCVRVSNGKTGSPSASSIAVSRPGKRAVTAGWILVSAASYRAAPNGPSHALSFGRERTWIPGRRALPGPRGTQDYAKRPQRR
jgi:hypothetical protein